MPALCGFAFVLTKGVTTILTADDPSECVVRNLSAFKSIIALELPVEKSGNYSPAAYFLGHCFAIYSNATFKKITE